MNVGNSYTFCANNPATLRDPSGKIIPILIGMAIGLALNATEQYLNTGTFDWSWGTTFDVALGGVTGGIGGKLVGAAAKGSVAAARAIRGIGAVGIIGGGVRAYSGLSQPDIKPGTFMRGILEAGLGYVAIRVPLSPVRAQKIVSSPARPTEPVQTTVAMVNGRAVPPSDMGGGYHGTNKLTADEALTLVTEGRPINLAKGGSLDLIQHVEPVPGVPNESAFVGTTPRPLMPQMGETGIAYTGAAEWAGEGGIVLGLRGIPTWRVADVLSGRIPTPGGYRGPLMTAENEGAVPGLIYARQVAEILRVGTDPSGRTTVTPFWSR